MNIHFFQSTHSKQFSWCLFLLYRKFGNSQIQHCRPVCWRRRDSLPKILYEIFELFVHPFLSEHSQKSICGGVLSSVVGCRLESYIDFILLKRNSSKKRFSGYFPMFSVQLFKNSFMKTSVMQVRRVLVCRLLTCVLIKK